MIAGLSLFFSMIHIKYVLFMSLWPRTIRIVISNWPRTRKFSQFFKKYRRGRPFLTMVTHWSRSRSNFYALIGQNLTGEFMQKIHAASWKLSFPSGCTNWNTAAIKSLLFIHGLFAFSFFGWEMRRLSNSVIWFWMASFFAFHLA